MTFPLFHLPSTLRRRSAGSSPLWFAAALLLFLTACSPHVKLYPQLEKMAAQGQYLKAAKLVEENKKVYGERNITLFNMDRGIFYHYAGRYKKSNQAFEQAERRIEDLYTESISGNIAAFALNDNTLPYRGEDFESVMINIYRAINYLQMGDVDGALVEARKVNEKLTLVNSNYDPKDRNDYGEDAFARMLMGALYEIGATREDINDAFISNRNAARLYRGDFSSKYKVSPPSTLAANLLTTATFMGAEEVAEAKKMFPGREVLSLAEKRGQGQLYFLHFAGRSPTKVEDAIRAIMPDGNRIKIVFPRYKPNIYAIAGSQVRIDGGEAIVLEVAEPVGAIAIKNLANRKARISLKAIARATAKYLANKALQKKARKRGGGTALLGFVAGNIFAEVSEQADLRSWQTLPDKILIGQAVVPPGKHTLQVEFLSRSGVALSTRDLGEVELRAGQTRFIVLHTLK